MVLWRIIFWKTISTQAKKRFKDNVKDNLKLMGIAEDNWEVLAADRDKWRKMIFNGANLYESNRIARAELRRACRKRESLPANCGSVWICEVCDRSLLSKAALVNHLKSHDRPGAATVIPCSIPTNEAHILSCPLCPKVCKSTGGLKRHLKIHGDAGSVAVAATSGSFACHICQLQCKSTAGLKSHLRAHGRRDQPDEEEEGMALV